MLETALPVVLAIPEGARFPPEGGPASGHPAHHRPGAAPAGPIGPDGGAAGEGEGGEGDDDPGVVHAQPDHIRSRSRSEGTTRSGAPQDSRSSGGSGATSTVRVPAARPAITSNLKSPTVTASTGGTPKRA